MREFAKVKLEEQIFGRMTEEIVLFDTREFLSRDIYDVCKPYFDISGKYKAEYDMLVYNKNTHEYYAFEIKHSPEAVKDQCKHLLNPEVREAVDFQFGNRKGVSVLYRGSPFKTTDGICYLNLADFLITLDQNKDIKSTMELLMKDLPVRDLLEETGTQTIESSGILIEDNAVETDDNDVYAILNSDDGSSFDDYAIAKPGAEVSDATKERRGDDYGDI